MGGRQGATRKAVPTEPEGETLCRASLEAALLTAVSTKDGWALYDNAENGYLTADTANGGRLRTKTVYDATAVWQVKFLPDGSALLQTVGNETYALQYRDGGFVYAPVTDEPTGVMLGIEGDWIVRNGGMLPVENETAHFSGTVRIDALCKAIRPGESLSFGLRVMTETYTIDIAVPIRWTKDLQNAASSETLAQQLNALGLSVVSASETEFTYQLEAELSDGPFLYAPYLLINGEAHSGDRRTGG